MNNRMNPYGVSPEYILAVTEEIDPLTGKTYPTLWDLISIQCGTPQVHALITHRGASSALAPYIPPPPQPRLIEMSINGQSYSLAEHVPAAPTPATVTNAFFDLWGVTIGGRKVPQDFNSRGKAELCMICHNALQCLSGIGNLKFDQFAYNQAIKNFNSTPSPSAQETPHAQTENGDPPGPPV